MAPASGRGCAAHEPRSRCVARAAGATVIVEPVGAHNSVVGADQGLRAPSWGLMCRILYRFLALLVRLAVRSGRSKDLEIIVLRHQPGVLHRRNNRPQLADEDRAPRPAPCPVLTMS